MKLLQLVSVIIASIVLTSCSHNKTAAVATPQLEQQWTCDTGAIVNWWAEDQTATTIQLRLDGGEKLYILRKVYSTDIGSLYSNGELAFRVKDQTGIIFWASNDEIIGQNCRAN